MPSSTYDKHGPLPSQSSNPCVKPSEFASQLLSVERCTRIVEAELRATQTPRWLIQRVVTAIRQAPLAGDSWERE
jgi:hypothetical protein